MAILNIIKKGLQTYNKIREVGIANPLPARILKFLSQIAQMKFLQMTQKTQMSFTV